VVATDSEHDLAVLRIATYPFVATLEPTGERDIPGLFGASTSVVRIASGCSP
jgi:hypothetical protein